MRTLSARTFSKFFGGKISPNLHSVSPHIMFVEKMLRPFIINKFTQQKLMQYFVQDITKITVK